MLKENGLCLSDSNPHVLSDHMLEKQDHIFRIMSNPNQIRDQRLVLAFLQSAFKF